MTEEQDQQVYAIATQTYPYMGKDTRSNFGYTGIPILSYVVPGFHDQGCAEEHHVSHRPFLYSEEEIPVVLKVLQDKGFKGLSVIDFRNRVHFDSTEDDRLKSLDDFVSEPRDRSIQQ